MKLVRSAFDALEVIAKRASNGLFDRIEFLCHIGLDAFGPANPHPGIFEASRF